MKDFKYKRIIWQNNNTILELLDEIGAVTPSGGSLFKHDYYLTANFLYYHVEGNRVFFGSSESLDNAPLLTLCEIKEMINAETGKKENKKTAFSFPLGIDRNPECFKIVYKSGRSSPLRPSDRLKLVEKTEGLFVEVLNRTLDGEVFTAGSISTLDISSIQVKEEYIPQLVSSETVFDRYEGRGVGIGSDYYIPEIEEVPSEHRGKMISNRGYVFLKQNEVAPKPELEELDPKQNFIFKPSTEREMVLFQTIMLEEGIIWQSGKKVTQYASSNWILVRDGKMTSIEFETSLGSYKHLGYAEHDITSIKRLFEVNDRDKKTDYFEPHPIPDGFYVSPTLVRNAFSGELRKNHDINMWYGTPGFSVGDKFTGKSGKPREIVKVGDTIIYTIEGSKKEYQISNKLLRENLDNGMLKEYS